MIVRQPEGFDVAEVAALRRALADQLGAERFRKFVQQFHSAGRLRFWQEQEWERFVATRSEFAVSENELSVALRVCWLHGEELQRESVVASHLELTEGYLRAVAAEFPCAGPVWSRGCPLPSPPVDVWVCPACRVTRTAWIQRHPETDAAVTAAEEAACWERTLAEIRDQRCPSCNGDAVSMLCYGLTDFSDAMNAALDAKLIRLRGCTFFEDDPEWECRDCHHTWGRVFPAVRQEAGLGAEPDCEHGSGS